MNTDKFIDLKHLSLQRLKDEYEKHNSLVIGFDFDGTVNDFHKEGYTFDKCRQLLRDLKEIGCKLVCWTAYKDLDEVARLLLEWGVPFDSINEGGINLGYESTKPFFNALLDDRAGLHQVFTELTMLVDWVKRKEIPQVTVVTAPEEYNHSSIFDITIFLAGSIDNGKYNWQETFSEKLLEQMKNHRVLENTKIRLLNPLREKWNKDLVQSKDNPEFKEQVIWEWSGIYDADLVIFNIVGDSASPITLLELGRCLGKGYDMLVSCPKEFYRHGNVEISMMLEGISNNLVETLDELITRIVEYLVKKCTPDEIF